MTIKTEKYIRFSETLQSELDYDFDFRIENETLLVIPKNESQPFLRLTNHIEQEGYSSFEIKIDNNLVSNLSKLPEHVIAPILSYLKNNNLYNEPDIQYIGQCEIGITSAEDKKPILLTHGAGPCKNLCVYNPRSKQAFLTHLDTPEALETLDDFIKEIDDGKQLQVYIGCDPVYTKGLSILKKLEEKLSKYDNLEIDKSLLYKSGSMQIDTRTGNVSPKTATSRMKQVVIPYTNQLENQKHKKTTTPKFIKKYINYMEPDENKLRCTYDSNYKSRKKLLISKFSLEYLLEASPEEFNTLSKEFEKISNKKSYQDQLWIDINNCKEKIESFLQSSTPSHWNFEKDISKKGAFKINLLDKDNNNLFQTTCQVINAESQIEFIEAISKLLYEKNIYHETSFNSLLKLANNAASIGGKYNFLKLNQRARENLELKFLNSDNQKNLISDFEKLNNVRKEKPLTSIVLRLCEKAGISHLIGQDPFLK